MSGPKTAADVRGLEYDWLACDGWGHVALFSTAGGSHAPAELLQDPDAYDRAIQALLSLPAHTQPLFAPSLSPGLRNDWAEVARRGLFAFDGDPNGGDYHKVSAPERPTRLTDLPEGLAAVAGRVVLAHVNLSVDRQVSAAALAARETPSPSARALGGRARAS